MYINYSIDILLIMQRFYNYSNLLMIHKVQFSCLVVSDSATLWTTACQASLSITNSRSLLKTHVHWVGDAIQPSHSLRAGGEGDNNLSQHQGLFKWVSSWHQVAKVLEFQLQHQSFQWTPRTDLLAVQGTLKRQRCKLWCQNVDKESKNAFELKLLSASNRLLHFM